MRRSRITVLFLMLLLTFSCRKESSEEASDESETRVSDEKFVEVFGVVKPVRIKNINLDGPCKIETIFVRTGTRITDRTPLLKIDMALYNLRLKNKSYELNSAKMDYLKTSIQYENTVNSRAVNIQKEKMDILEHELNIIRKNLENYSIKDDGILYTDIKNGVISEIGYNEGDIVVSDRKIFSIIDLDSMVVEAEIPEEIIKDVKIGNRAVIKPLSDSTREYKGEVVRLSSLAVSRGGETVVICDIKIADTDEFLLPYFNADIKIYSSKE